MKNSFFTTTRIIMLSFLAVILLGSLLLALPVSTKSGQPVPYVDALFTAVTSTSKPAAFASSVKAACGISL